MAIRMGPNGYELDEVELEKRRRERLSHELANREAARRDAEQKWVPGTPPEKAATETITLLKLIPWQRLRVREGDVGYQGESACPRPRLQPVYFLRRECAGCNAASEHTLVEGGGRIFLRCNSCSALRFLALAVAGSDDRASEPAPKELKPLDLVAAHEENPGLKGECPVCGAVTKQSLVARDTRILLRCADCKMLPAEAVAILAYVSEPQGRPTETIAPEQPRVYGFARRRSGS